ncbi:MAG: helix-turn-helix domain-containing protein [Duncaniella sp.]|nr:helix-turn-helix domain-containing protein [Duncaniella sp.]
MTKDLHDYIVFSTDFGMINSPAFYDCVVHMICTRGAGKFDYNGTRFEIKANDIAVLSQTRLVTSIEADSDFRCRYIAAPDRFLHNLLPANSYAIQGCVSLFDNPVIHADREDALRFITDLDNIRQRIADTHHRFYREMMGSLLLTMIYDLFDFHAKNNDNVLTTDRVGYITSQFFAMIEAGVPATEREVSHYAGQLNVSPKYLADTIKRVTGTNASTHINSAAAAIAISLLNDSPMSITQIADEMKFSSLSHFSRFCVKHIGMSPSRFRTVNANP